MLWYIARTQQQLLESLDGFGFQVETIELPDGEQYKELLYLTKIFDLLLEKKYSRIHPTESVYVLMPDSFRFASKILWKRRRRCLDWWHFGENLA
jgi:hypothetical protein